MEKFNLIPKFCCFGYALLIMVLFSSCRNHEHKSNKISPDFEFKNIDVRGGWQYQIIIYKEHEYLCNSSNGGIIHTESCSCKKH